MNNTIKIWLDISKSDLISSQILYKNGKYRNSYFLFQQAAEKANKAFALHCEILTEKELLKIQHDQTKIYRKTLVKQEKSIAETIELLKPFKDPNDLKIFSLQQFSNQHTELKKSISFIDSLRNCDLVNFTTKDLNASLKQIKGIRDFKIKLPKDFNNIMESQMLAMGEWIGQFDIDKAKSSKKEIQDFLRNKDESKRFFELLKTTIYPLIFELMFINLTLYICAILTVQHSSLSRYPSDGINPESIYLKKLPIVRKQPEFMKLLMEVITRMEKITQTEKNVAQQCL